MARHRRSFTVAQKLEIINFCKAHGVTRARREYDLSDSVVRRWLDRYEDKGVEGLTHKSKSTPSELEVENAQLKRELRAYKEMLAERDLALRIKEELLKKSQTRLMKE